MKKLILLTFIVAISVFANAQSFKILDTLGNDITSGTLNVIGDPSAIASTKAWVVNISGTTKNVKVKRIENNLVSGSEDYFCWTQCYAPMVSVSPTAEAMNSADTIKKFVSDLDSKGYTGTSNITYVFYDISNTTDTAYFNINFIINPTGLSHVSPEIQLSPAYPNPASTDIRLNYKVNKAEGSHISIYNMLGSVIKTIELTNNEGKLTLPVNDLREGIYFYSLFSEGQKTATKKFTVSR